MSKNNPTVGIHFQMDIPLSHALDRACARSGRAKKHEAMARLRDHLIRFDASFSESKTPEITSK